MSTCKYMIEFGNTNRAQKSPGTFVEIDITWI
jgi:hypothetical protein